MDTFVTELSRARDETVMIFVQMGGTPGAGFAGVLTAVNTDYVTLVANVSTPPAGTPAPVVTITPVPPGATIHIPINKIVALVRNTT